jgi:hypothetical protein
MKKRFLALALGTILGAMSAPALAADTASAGAHFERGVALYGEADYKAALTEFKRAYEMAPNPLVLYNIGQTQFQLRNYSAALTSFERYLAEAGANPPHAQEVQHSVEVLKTRVGRVDIDANVPSEVLIDDEPQGKTPIAKLLVSVGKHKVVAKHDGAPPQEKTIDVAAGDSVPVSFTFDTAPKPAPAASVTLPPATPEERPPYATIAWVSAGALAVGAVVTGIVATSSASSLSDERESATATRERLDSLSSRTTTFGIVTDVLAASAVVAGGVALYFTLSKPSSTKSASALGVSPTGLTFRLSY